MRVKFKANDIMPDLEFGKIYDVALFGCSFWWRFKLTRGRNLFIEEIKAKNKDGIITTEVFGRFKVSKKEFKRYLRDDIVTYVSEYHSKHP